MQELSINDSEVESIQHYTACEQKSSAICAVQRLSPLIATCCHPGNFNAHPLPRIIEQHVRVKKKALGWYKRRVH